MSTRALTPQEETALIKTIAERKRTERDIIVVRLPLETGLRLREAAGLLWQDITSLHGDLLPRFSLRPEIAKRHKARTIELNKVIRAELESYRKWYARQYKADNGPLFISKKGSRLSPRQIERISDKWFSTAGITGVTYHGLRHTFACKVFNHTHDLRKVRVLLGHEKIVTTQIYIDHLNQAELEQAVDW